jgi:hypothetical protein
MSDATTDSESIQEVSAGSDSFIGFPGLENVGLEPNIVSPSRSQADISLF